MEEGRASLSILFFSRRIIASLFMHWDVGNIRSTGVRDPHPRTPPRTHANPSIYVSLSWILLEPC